MKKLIIIVSFCSIFFAVIYGAFAIVPKSLQIYLASIATCDITDEQLRNIDDQFVSAKWWERPVSQLYRAKYWFSMGQPLISEELSGDLSVLHLSLTAAVSNENICDREALALFTRFIEQGAPIDYYDSLGYTVLQQAIIYRKPEFVKVLLDNGANPELKVKRKDSPLFDLDSVKIAQYFMGKNGEESLQEIMELLN